jgi:uncharacterized membrane protein
VLSVRTIAAPVVIGIGVGGFFDGIVLHQLLQWHHVLSNVVPVTDVAALELNTFWDGVFHQAMWIVTVVGVFLLYGQLARTERRGYGALVGGVLVGWGLFNVTDQVVFHMLFNLHNIRPGPDYLLYDLAFTVWGVAMIAAGGWLVRRSELGRAATPPSPR